MLFDETLIGGQAENADDPTVKGRIVGAFPGNGFNMHGVFLLIHGEDGRLRELHYSLAKVTRKAAPAAPRGSEDKKG